LINSLYNQLKKYYNWLRNLFSGNGDRKFKNKVENEKNSSFYAIG